MGGSRKENSPEGFLKEIKSVEKAEKSAEKLLHKAQKKAQKIVSEANAKAVSLQARASKESVLQKDKIIKQSRKDTDKQVQKILTNAQGNAERISKKLLQTQKASSLADSLLFKG